MRVERRRIKRKKVRARKRMTKVAEMLQNHHQRKKEKCSNLSNQSVKRVNSRRRKAKREGNQEGRRRKLQKV